MSSPRSRAVAAPPDPGLLSLYDEALLVRARTAFRRLYITTGGSDD